MTFSAIRADQVATPLATLLAIFFGNSESRTAAAWDQELPERRFAHFLHTNSLFECSIQFPRMPFDVVRVIQAGSSVAAMIAAFWALVVYRSNSRRERARWAENLYSRFYEKEELKRVRDMLDCSAGDPDVARLVADESSAWTDYLNFFEFVAYLQLSKQLSQQDVEALFSYYLGCLKKHPEVAAYIRDPAKGYEKLRSQLFNE